MSDRLPPLLLGLVLALAVPWGRASELTSDRPDFVESTDVVDAGRFQIETSFLRETDRSDGLKMRTWTTPTLLRLGIGHDLELRVETDGHVRSREQDLATGVTTRNRGWSDTALGIKWHQQSADDDDHVPAIAWLLHVDVDSGSAPYRGQGLRPSLRGVWEWELPGDASVAFLGGVVLDRNATGKRYAGVMAALTYEKTLVPKLHGFVELAAQQLASKRNGGNVLSFDAGVFYVVTDDLQVDLSFLRGLNDRTPDLQWGVGLSARF